MSDMRNEWSHIERYRVRRGTLSSSPNNHFGAFKIPFRGRELTILATDGKEMSPVWEHVSASLPNRVPNWEEMSHIKALFWNDDETVVQFHPARSAYVNNHPFCLHLWRDPVKGHELPPEILVGIKGRE